MFTYDLAQGPTHAELVGGKAASLGFLLQYNIQIPTGFVITTDAHRYFLSANAFDSLEPVSASRILSGVMPSEIIRAISGSMDRWGADTRFAVRSSGVFEDSSHASFAGQYDTILDVGKDEVLSAVKRCWASAASNHALSYTRDRGVSIGDCVMGVVVQALIDAKTSGVGFSIHPVTGAECVVINASWGLGEPVVSGLVTPDAFEIDKQSQVIEKTMGFKECEMRIKRSGGTEVVEVPLVKRDIFCLPDEKIWQVYQMTCQLERLIGYPVDIEWAFDHETLFCLQMRPITRGQREENLS